MKPPAASSPFSPIRTLLAGILCGLLALAAAPGGWSVGAPARMADGAHRIDATAPVLGVLVMAEAQPLGAPRPGGTALPCPDFPFSRTETLCLRPRRTAVACPPAGRNPPPAARTLVGTVELRI